MKNKKKKILLNQHMRIRMRSVTFKSIYCIFYYALIPAIVFTERKYFSFKKPIFKRSCYAPNQCFIFFGSKEWISCAIQVFNFIPSFRKESPKL